MSNSLRSTTRAATEVAATAIDPRMSNGKYTPRNTRAQLVSAAKTMAMLPTYFARAQVSMPNATVHMAVSWSLGKLLSGA